MTDLRAALIEAGARALAGRSEDAWGRSTEQSKSQYRPRAEAVIDAFLDTLADRADEWADSGREFDTISSAGNVTDKGYVFRLIAVLRGDTE